MRDIKEEFRKLGIIITDKMSEQFNLYYEMLIEKNKVMNLTAITDYDDVVIKHFIDSAAIIKVIDSFENISIIDVGTGAGFPGIVIKILFPSVSAVLLDSLNKRVNFLKDVIRELKLDNITAVHGRAEDIAHKSEYREKFDIATARAVTNMSVLAEYCLPFVKNDGHFVAYKSSDCDEEVKSAGKAIITLGGNDPELYKFKLPDTEIDRCFVSIRKVKKSPILYPRKAGLPSKEPIS